MAGGQRRYCPFWYSLRVALVIVFHAWARSAASLDHVGDVLGRVLGWAWRTDPDRIFMKAITDYVGGLSQVVGRRITLQDIRPAMSKGLGGGALGLSEVAAALTYADQHWDQWALPASFDLPDDDAKTSP